MATKSELLIKLALKEFPNLTAPEFEVVRAAGAGEWADLLQWGTPPPKPKKYNPGGGPLRSGLVTWLCTDTRAKRLVHRKGLRIANATIDAKLDLERTEVPFFFGLHNCYLPGLNAQGATFKDDLYLDRSRVDGEVNILGVTITGQFSCEGARLFNRGGIALRADNATAGDNVYFSQGFHAEGEVRLNGATITGQLNCRAGIFWNRNGHALKIDGATIGSDVLLSTGFRAKGEVRLPGAKITGQFDCEGGIFLNDTGCALVLDCATILDTIFLEPESVQGVISLHRTEATQTLRMLSPALAKASLNLSGAKVGLLYDARDSWPAQDKLQLDGFHYDSIHRDSPMNSKERLDWLGRQPQDQFSPQPYEKLATFFQRAGHDSEAKDVRIAKEDARQRYFKNPIKKAWWFLKWATIGYGYRPQRAIYLLLGLILIGSAVYWRNMDNMTPSVSYHYNATDSSDVKGNFIASNYPDLNTLLYSIDVALPIVDLQQERYWMPNSDTTSGRFLWWFNWAEVLLGWFLASMGIAGATGIIRKD